MVNAMKKLIFRLSLGAITLALIFATLQILFDIPVAPFLLPAGAGTLKAEITAKYDDGVQYVSAQLNTVAYPSLIVQRGIPVEFKLVAAPKNIDKCNEWILLPEYNIEKMLLPGDNLLRFTPDRSGVFQIVCGMSRMKSTVTVVENLGFSVIDTEAAQTPTYRRHTVTPTQQIISNAAPNFEEQPISQITSNTVSNSEETPLFEKPDNGGAGLGGWLERQLMPQSGADGVHEIRIWTGWLFDRCCVGISPVLHTKACNLMGGCYESGIGIFEYVPGKAFDTYTAIDTFLCFDGASKELAVAFLKALPEDWKNNVTVTVKGYAINNIPASTDELLVPETDLSRVDHYLNGIHVTSIEATYIYGISTYKIPVPNIAFTQP